MRKPLRTITCAMLASVIVMITPTACKKPVDTPVAPASTEKGLLKLSLPSGVKFTSEQLSVITSGGTFTPKNGVAEISGIDPTNQSVAIVEMPDSGLTLFGIQFKGETTVEVSASSTALALLMINPLTPNMTLDDCKRLAAAYKKHELFSQLVKDIEGYIILNKDYIEFNSKVLKLVNQIHGSSVNLSGRQAASSSTASGTHSALAKPDFSGSKITLQNKASFLPYMAGIYDDKNVIVETLDLKNVTIENRSIDYLFINTFLTLTNWRDCFDGFGARPTSNCPANGKEFYKAAVPQAVTSAALKDGRYTVKVTNAFSSKTGIDALKKKAQLHTVLQIMKDMLSIADDKLSSKFNKTEEQCLMAVMGDYFINIFKTGSNAYASRDPYAIVRDIAIAILDRSADFSKCLTPDESIFLKKYLTKYLAITRLLEAFKQVGAGANVFAMMVSAEVDQDYYEYPIDVKNGMISAVSPSGTIAIEGFCHYETMIIPPGVTNTTSGHGYRFKLNLKDEFKDYPNRQIYLVTPSGAYFVPLGFDESDNTASLSYQTIQLSAANPTYYNPTKYKIEYMFNASSKGDPYPLTLYGDSGLYKMMIVLYDEKFSNYIKSELVTLPQAFNPDSPCVNSEVGYNPVFKPVTVPFK